MADLLPADEKGLARAEALVRDGAVVAFPSENAYGLAADAWSADAVARIFALKKRPSDAPISLIAGNLGAAADVIAPSADEFARGGRSLDGVTAALAAKFWPGRLTLIVPAHPRLPSALTAGRGVVGVRVSPNPIATRLSRAVGVITATSANLHGRAPSRTAAEVLAAFPGIALVLDGGECEAGAPSTIVDTTRVPPRLVREGAVPFLALVKVVPTLRPAPPETSP